MPRARPDIAADLATLRDGAFSVLERLAEDRGLPDDIRAEARRVLKRARARLAARSVQA
jgi:ElaB/YqjD/DUF883 family membrane-anchored ribosome-binding protein